MSLGYALNRDLRIGDIILLSSSTKFGQVIKKVTDGPFSHVSLVYDNGKIIEALTAGIQTSAAHRFQVKDKNHIKILRPKIFENIDWTDELREKFIKIAAPNRYLKYNYLGVLSSQFKINVNVNHKYFCSEMVTEIYKEYGLQLFNKESSKVVPNDFLDVIGTKLNDVTKKVLSEIPDCIGILEMQLNFLDDEGTTTSDESKRFTLFMDKVYDIFESYGISIKRKTSPFQLVEIIQNIEDKNIKSYLDKKLSELYDQVELYYNAATRVNEITEEENNFYKEEFKNKLARYSTEDLIGVLGLAEQNIKDSEKLIFEFNYYIKNLSEITENSNDILFAKQLEEYFLFHLTYQFKAAMITSEKVKILYKFIYTRIKN